jgi:hypothetical protein
VLDSLIGRGTATLSDGHSRSSSDDVIFEVTLTVHSPLLRWQWNVPIQLFGDYELHIPDHGFLPEGQGMGPQFLSATAQGHQSGFAPG